MCIGHLVANGDWMLRYRQTQIAKKAQPYPTSYSYCCKWLICLCRLLYAYGWVDSGGPSTLVASIGWMGHTEYFPTSSDW